jgi:hypothetical protein
MIIKGFVNENGKYTFSIEYSDGNRLIIDGSKVEIT